MHKIKWLRRAEKNLVSIHAYINLENTDAAKATIDKIRIGINKLKEYPFMGRVGRVAGTRELVIGGTPYIVIYQVKEDTIVVLRILHSAKKFP